MRHTVKQLPYALICLLLLTATHASAQGSKTDYERAEALGKRLHGKVERGSLQTIWARDSALNNDIIAVWHLQELGKGKRRWMKTSIKTGETSVAFNHTKLATALGQAVGKRVDPDRLPLKKLSVLSSSSIGFDAFGKRWNYASALDVLEENKVSVFGSSRRQRRSGPRSPDAAWRAATSGHNVVLYKLDDKGKPTKDKPIALTTDGTKDQPYINRFYWSPDSRRLVAIRHKPGSDRRVTIIESTPKDRLQPKTHAFRYRKPGDDLPIDRPVLIDVPGKKIIPVSHELAPTPFRNSDVRWKTDSSAFTYHYNQRGHQAYRVIEVDAESGKSRAVIDESSKTFLCYSRNFFIDHLDKIDEILWLSERDGWNHLYLYDWKAGKVKRQVTKGRWVVRRVDRVDQKNRTVWFWAGGIHKGQDPYYLHYCRVDLDTGKVTPLTASDGTHTDMKVSPDGKALVTTWSRVDHAPVHELRSAVTGRLIKVLAKADASALKKAGWIAPEPFVAKGRDGKTDIYGIIIKPTNFDPKKKYPVIEQIYAGPHGAHVPKQFRGMYGNMRLAELGFIVVQIDGMGTNHRSKAFHDVCWKNLKDAGLPDRIAWMKAAAKTRPWMDLSRVGIYGGSAGGQNAMRAVLDHADFYKAAAADCGCHDNRMDKIWWNEQWMGWPIDDSYKKSSNAVDAHKLGGKLLLTVGELDRNVDPASTMQVVKALIKANKEFEFMVFPGGGHGAGGGGYGRRLRADFFVRHLMGKTPRWESVTQQR